ncbi:MAG: succinyldiaminopimelate transaminase [Chromatiaceae bacterium]|jgi:N-succinyldiaminopimelate aminotransferase|nr:succinyldiaminopimelate transaminase [Chromatiaceae bacterium]
MNPDLDRLQPYPFERLAELKAGARPPAGLAHIALSIGEPKHPTPALVLEALGAHRGEAAVYPTTRGLPALRAVIADWLTERYRLPRGSIDPAHQVLPVNGTREALFAFAQAVVDRGRDPLVLMPNPFYQIYEGAALLAGAEPRYLPCTAENGFLPDVDAVDDATWRRCQLLYLCSPGNPTGAVLDIPVLQRVIALADEHDFVIAADECYAELYFDESAPPPGLLQAAAAMGRSDYRRCVVFHSLSKRSNAPGLRSGFVAGDAEVIGAFLRYRTYHGCAMPPHHQHASIAAWGDEDHVRANRAQYRAKLDAVLEILAPVLAVDRPRAGFYLWPETPIADTDFARALFAAEHVTVLPGRFLSREVGGLDPGAGRVRMALVPPLESCTEAARRIRRFVESL